MNKKLIIKVLILALVSTILMTALMGCMGNNQAQNDPYKMTEADTDGVAYFTRVLLLNPDARVKFVAAANGYNMSAEGFDDSKVDLANPSDPAKAPDAAANDGVSIAGARDALTKNVYPQGFDDQQKFAAWLEGLDAQAVRDIVARMATTVELEAQNGFIDTILTWIGKFLKILTVVTGGYYVLGLFLFAIVVELVMIPFAIKQQKTSIKQAKLRPREMAIRNKYKGRKDQATMQKMQQEIQALYQSEGVSPMGGCLPLLIQIPILLALYQIVIDPLRYVLGGSASLSGALATYCSTAKAAGGLGMSIGSGKGTIELLAMAGDKLDGLAGFSFFQNGGACLDALKASAMPNFNLFGTNMGQIPGFHQPYGLLLIPVLTFAIYFASMKLNRKFSYQPTANDPQMGCSNNVMDITMPLMSVYITFIVPAAVGIYWMFKSIISTLKQFIMHKVMPTPVFTEEDYKAAERELKGKSKGKSEKAPAGTRTTASGKPVRSLHHIDDDDYDLPPLPKKGAKNTPAEEKKADEVKTEEVSKEKDDAPAIKLDVPNLKEDRKNDTNK